MVDFVVFLFTQLFNFINYFDSIIVFGNLSLLKIIIIVLLFSIGIKLLSFGGDKK